MENENVVKGESTTQQPSEGQGVPATVEAGPTPAPGSQTPSELLLQSLKEEREKRRLLEEEKKLLEEKLNDQSSDDEPVSDEGKLLRKQIAEVKSELEKVKEEKEKDKLFAMYPILKDKQEEFNEYRENEHPRAK